MLPRLLNELPSQALPYVVGAHPQMFEHGSALAGDQDVETGQFGAQVADKHHVGIDVFGREGQPTAPEVDPAIWITPVALGSNGNLSELRRLLGSGSNVFHWHAPTIWFYNESSRIQLQGQAENAVRLPNSGPR